jgi:hypothetical protein
VIALLKAFIEWPLGPDWKLRQAAKVLRQARIRREKALIRRVARQLCVESNRDIPPALRG